MRITFLVSKINLDTGGGSNYSCHLTASELARLGHTIRVITLNEGDTHLPECLPYAVTSARASDRSRLARTRTVARLLREYAENTDVFHLYDPALALAGGLYKRARSSKPVVVTLNHYQLFCTNPDIMDGQCHRQCGVAKRLLHSKSPPLRRLLSVQMRLYEQWFGFEHVNQIDHFFPDSPAVQDVYAGAGFDMRKSTVIPEVIDYAGLRASSRDARAGGEAGTWQVLFAGRLVAGKGVDVLLDALRRLDGMPVHLHIAGDGPERQPLAARARALGLESKTTFHGWVANDQLWHVYQQMDLFVHPGTWPEPCGRTVQEAMAVGVPVIASDVGGPPWLLGSFGRTFRPGDAIDLATQMRTCFEQYSEALELARGASQRAAEFDYPRVVPQLNDVYERLATN